MKILHWDEMFHPNFGYQINVLPVYQKKQGHEVVIMTASYPEKHPTFVAFADPKDNIALLDKKYMEETGVKVIRLPIWGVYSGRVIYKPGFINEINKEKPDVILCHTSDTLSSMQIIWKHRKIKAPIVFDNHMLEMGSANRFRNIFRSFYKSFITPIIKENHYITIRTQDDDYVNRCLGIPKDLTPYISFGSDTDLFKPDEKKRMKTRNELGIPQNAFVIIYAGKIDKAKNGLLLAKAIEKKFDTSKKVYIIIISNEINDEYGQIVEETLRKSENIIIRKPTQPYRALASFYAAADLAVFPRQCSLSFFDVQAAGLPVVLECNNVNSERVNYGNGYTFEPDDYLDFRNKIIDFIELPDNKFREMREVSRKRVVESFDYTQIALQYTEVLCREMRRQNACRQRMK